MNKLRKILYGSIYSKLLVAFMIVIVPVFTLSLFLSVENEKIVYENLANATTSKMEFYSQLLDVEFVRINNMQKELINDRNLIRITEFNDVISEIEWRESIINLQNRLNQITATSPYIKDISLFFPKQKEKLTTTIYTNDILESEYTPFTKDKSLIQNPLNYKEDQLFLSFYFSPYALTSLEEPLILINARVNTVEVQSILQKMMNNQMGYVFFISPDMKWSISDGRTNPPVLDVKTLTTMTESSQDNQTLNRVAIDGVEYFVSHIRSDEYGYHVAVMTPMREMLAPLNYYQRVFWILLFFSIAIVVVFAYWIYLQIHKPLKFLIKGFRKLEQGRFQIIPGRKREDEFDHLYQQYNLMVQQIDKLFHEVGEERYRANLAELRQLQAQINPHFLYNIFFQLNCMIADEDIENSKKFTQNLGQYFFYIFHNKKQEVPLSDEVEYIRTYMNIQSFRFEDRIVATLAPIPESVKNLPVPKLLLQPIVENAYVHAFGNKVEQGTLHISFETEPEDRMLVISIKDNGPGLSPTELSKLCDELKTNDSIQSSALHNTHRRLQMKYGGRANLQLSNLEGKGFCVKIMIPLIEKLE